ncbi:MAG: oligosaccharide flippase family protein [Ignavibacteriales bacterium]|nr:oligosaccharide flippase family protein [Ignavibacteriales bacterium]
MAIIENLKEILKTFTYRGVYVLLSNLLEKSAFFFLSIIIARNFSESIFGFVTASFAFANIIISFFEFGFNFYFQREAAAETPDLQEKFSQALSLRAITFVLYAALSVLYFFYTSDQYFIPALLLGLSVFVFSINNLFNALLFGKNDYRSSFLALLFSRIILFAAVFAGIYVTANLFLTCLGFVAGGLVQFALLSGILKKHAIRIKLAMPHKEKLLPILNSSFPFAIGVIFVWLYDRGDVLILRQFRGDEAIAIYAVAYSVYKLPQALANFIFTPMFTEFSSIFAKTGYLSFLHLRHQAINLLLICTPLTGLLYFFSSSIITGLFGGTYSQAANLLPLLLIALPALFANNFTGIILNAARFEKVAAKSVIYTAVFNIIINFALIPLWGLMGAVIATIFTEYCTFIIQITYIYRSKIIKRNQDN